MLTGLAGLLCGPAWAEPPPVLSGPPAGATFGPALYGASVTVAVPAGQSWPLIGASASRRVLIIAPHVPGSPCFVDLSEGVASPDSMPIPNGFVFDAGTPPPKKAVTVYCQSAASISVTEGN